jgi:hypothetical protein
MINPVLYPLIPRPLEIRTGALEGKLLIDGSIERNIIRFSFVFTRPQELAPLRISVSAGRQGFRYYCLQRDEKTGTTSTPIFEPEFCVGQRFSVTAVEPLAEFSPEDCPSPPAALRQVC